MKTNISLIENYKNYKNNFKSTESIRKKLKELIKKEEKNNSFSSTKMIKLITLEYYFRHYGTYHPNKVVKILQRWSDYYMTKQGKTCSGHYSLVQVSGRFFKINNINDIWVSYEVGYDRHKKY